MRKEILTLLLSLLALGLTAPAAAQITVGVANGGRMSGQAVVNQLNDDTHFDFQATLVGPADIDTADELANFNVIIIGDAGHNDDGYTTPMAQALETCAM